MLVVPFLAVHNLSTAMIDFFNDKFYGISIGSKLFFDGLEFVFQIFFTANFEGPVYYKDLTVLRIWIAWEELSKSKSLPE